MVTKLNNQPHISQGLPTHLQSAPLTRFPLAAAQREPLPVPASHKGFCELCGNPLENGQVKFCTSQPFDCQQRFYQICKQNGPALVARMIFLRNTRPRRSGERMTGAAKTANREVWKITDDLISRIKDARKELPR